jgi:hypothetical protein
MNAASWNGVAKYLRPPARNTIGWVVPEGHMPPPLEAPNGLSTSRPRGGVGDIKQDPGVDSNLVTPIETA